MAKDDNDDDYKIGFNKPPVWSRFRSGRSGIRRAGRRDAKTRPLFFTMLATRRSR
jgi:hypothetical protein